MTTRLPLFDTDRSADVVNARMDEAAAPRLRQMMAALVRNLHAAVKEVEPTQQEWMAAIQFLTRTGQMCSATRQEFILLSDALGVSMLVDALEHGDHGDATPSTVLGPFHVPGAPLLAQGTDLCREGGAGRGESLQVAGSVCDTEGRSIDAALLDVWQANDAGFYDVQQPGVQPEMNLRGRFACDAAGRYHFRSVKPRSYPIPHDGPVGQLLQALGRHPFRPAHLHFIVSAPGYRTLTTHVFPPDDPYLDSDAVFGVKPELIREFRRTGTDAAGRPTWAVDCDFALVAEPG